jgi:hypothetical protein
MGTAGGANPLATAAENRAFLLAMQEAPAEDEDEDVPMSASPNEPGAPPP